MGLIKAVKDAVGGVFADQWREYFYSDSLENDVLVVKGRKRQSDKRSSNNKAEENIISNGSIISVNVGQCMIIVEQGKVVECCAESGEFVYDTSTEPSIFYGNLGENIKNSFLTIGKRFTFGGDTAKDQRIYYFNTKEIKANKYGTPNPVPFRVVDKNIGLDIDIAIRCNGEYSYIIKDPILFYTNVCGNVVDEYRKDEIDSQLKTELLTALQPAFAKLSELGIRYSAVPGHTQELSVAINEVLTEKWLKLRGIAIFSFGVNSVVASEEDEAMIKQLQKTAVFRNVDMAAANIVDAQAEAMKSAAKNEATGPMFAFAGMNMAANAGGMNANNLFEMGQDKANQQQGANSQQQPVIQPVSTDGWDCTCGVKNNKGKFCVECGAPKPAQTLGWTCQCGVVNKGKFCVECGTKKPADAILYRCDKCGWEPVDPKNPPKFCPECGDLFDDKDVK